MEQRFAAVGAGRAVTFGDAYAGRRVLVTGHTGFKGSWLTSWLLRLGAEVTGVSVDIPTQPSMFEELALEGQVTHVRADLRDLEAVRDAVSTARPDFVFHLAAQAIVSESYREPIDTMTTNVIGTLHVLEALRQVEHPCAAVLITSDKCYDNVEWVWGYRETDALGGKDIYSGSKGAAELVIKSYRHSFFPDGHPVRLAVGRAGNVIGGGDWAPDRLVVDCVRAWSAGRSVEVRSPGATRPWQHVLEPLSGYLALGHAITHRPELHGEAFNFGPRAEEAHTVAELLSDLGRQWGFEDPQDAYQVTQESSFHEAGLLRLSCDKALLQLGWETNLTYDETILLVADWYSAYYGDRPDLHALTLEQIGAYESAAVERGRTWAR